MVTPPAPPAASLSADSASSPGRSAGAAGTGDTNVTVASWAELATQWQVLAAEWTRTWATTFAPQADRAGDSRLPLDRGSNAGPHREGAAAMHSSARGNDAGASSQDGDWRVLVDRYEMELRAAWRRVAPNAGELPPLPEADLQDRRFSAPEWTSHAYFDLVRRTYLLSSHYARHWASHGPHDGADARERKRLAFFVRQLIDASAPSNFAATNPEAIRIAFETRGESLRAGIRNLVGDAQRGRISMTDETAFEVGRNLAITPGDVVWRSDLVELIQYRPTTRAVRARPLVIVPPCINKYYILDLQPENSFVRYAVEQGHTVFMVSWRNVPRELGKLGWDDYVEQGVVKVLDVALAITKADRANVLGFCVGGTLLATGLAALARRRDARVASATFFTTMLDFADPGDIGVFVREEFLHAREPALLAGTRIHGGELAGAFASLRANELVWNYVVNNYLKGRTPPALDLLHWNSDSANLPGPMYVWYLRNLYLGNRLREPGALTVLGERIDLGEIRVPTFVLSTREDHIVPWHSAYASARLLGGPTRFVLGASGHIAGVVNPPARGKRNFWVGPTPATLPDASAWLAAAESHGGSWWPTWAGWLDAHAGGSIGPARRSGNGAYRPLGPAPGRYVLEASGPVVAAA